MEKKKGFIDRFFKEPAKELTGFAWKLSAFGAIIAVALGQYQPALQLAMISVAANIIHNEATRSMQKA